MSTPKIKTIKDIAPAHNNILKNLDSIKNKLKKQLDRLQNGFTNEQKKGAEITARKKQK